MRPILIVYFLYNLCYSFLSKIKRYAKEAVAFFNALDACYGV